MSNQSTIKSTTQRSVVGPNVDAGDAGGGGGPIPNTGPIIVNPTTGLVTSESGRTAQFTIFLKSKGGVAGGLALSKHSRLTDACARGSCPPSEQAMLDSYHRLGTIADVGFIVGGIGVAAGVVLLLTQPKETPSSKDSSASTAKWSPYLGVGSAGVSGVF